MNEQLIRLCMIGAVVAALAAAGCQSTSGSSSAEPQTSADGQIAVTRADLIPSARPPIPDLPIPWNFKLLEPVSRNYETHGARFVDHSYQGRAEKDLVERFVRIQMPMKGWTFRSARMVRGTHVLRYEKGSEECDVTISSSHRPLLGEVSTLSYSVQTVGSGEVRKYDPVAPRPNAGKTNEK